MLPIPFVTIPFVTRYLLWKYLSLHDTCCYMIPLTTLMPFLSILILSKGFSSNIIILWWNPAHKNGKNWRILTAFWDFENAGISIVVYFRLKRNERSQESEHLLPNRIHQSLVSFGVFTQGPSFSRWGDSSRVFLPRNNLADFPKNFSSILSWYFCILLIESFIVT